MRDQFALILDQTRALGIGNKAAVEWGTDEIMRLLRQGPTVTVTRDKHGYQYASLPGVVVDDLVAERSYALVLLPEEDG